MEADKQQGQDLPQSGASKPSFFKRIRRNFAWALLPAIYCVDGFHLRRLLLILAWAAGGAVLYSLFDVGVERWPQPFWVFFKRRGKTND